MMNKRIKTIISEVLFIALTLIMMLPGYYLIITTFITPEDATLNPLSLPKVFQIQGYINAWIGMEYPRAFMNTFIITACSLGGVLLVSAMASYAIARKRNKVNHVVFMLFLAGMMVPFQMSIMSQYKLITSLGLMNKLPSVILINIAVNLPVSVLFMRNFIAASVPIEVEEAAYIDGWSVWRTFFSITLPLLKPVVATLAVMNSIGIWNDFLTPLMFLQSSESYTLLLQVNSNFGRFSTNWTNMFPMMMLAVAPLVIFFLIMQKNIIKGVSTGAVKG
jgi:raffinose/stachyose/melibiose transport system permease protein